MKKIILFLSVLTALSLNGYGQNTPVTAIPFKLANNTILITCRVNNSADLTFLFDTGADGMVINKLSLDKLNLTFDTTGLNKGNAGTDTVRVSNNNMLSFGSLSEINVSFVEIGYQNSNFDGVFGSNIMRKYVIEIDYEKKLMKFFDPKTYRSKLSGYQKLRLKNLSGLYTVKSSVVIDKRRFRGNFEIDTGGDNALMITTPFNKKYQFDQQLKKIAQSTAIGSDGKEVVEPMVLMPKIKIGEMMFYQIPVDLSFSLDGVSASERMAGIFGLNFLKRFNTVLDLANEHIYLKPNNLTHTPYIDFLVK